MQSSLFQTGGFILFMLSAYCTSSMLPCGRYYYEPEGGYVGNPWVKFSYQYIYLYLGWFLHHLDLIEHYAYQFTQTFYKKCKKVSNVFSFNKNYSVQNVGKPTKQISARFQNTNLCAF